MYLKTITYKGGHYGRKNVELRYCDAAIGANEIFHIDKDSSMVEYNGIDIHCPHFCSEREAISVAKKFFKVKKATRKIREEYKNYGRIFEVIHEKRFMPNL